MNWPIPKPGTTVTEAELLSLGIDPRAPVGKREPGPALDVRCGAHRYTRRACDGGVTVHYDYYSEHQTAARKTWAMALETKLRQRMSLFGQPDPR